jgi:hypothetical protein
VTAKEQMLLGKNLFLAWRWLASRGGGLLSVGSPRTPEHCRAFEARAGQGRGERGGCKQNIFAKNILVQKSFSLPLSLFFFLLLLLENQSLIKTTPEYFMLISIRRKRRNLKFYFLT